MIDWSIWLIISSGIQEGGFSSPTGSFRKSLSVEDPAEAAVRETKEEGGVDVELKNGDTHMFL